MSNAPAVSAIEIDLLDRDEEVASLARMLAFARNTAQDLGLDQTVYCLTMSLQSLAQHVKSEDPTDFHPHENFQIVTSRH